MINAIVFDMTGVLTRSPIRMLEEYGDRLGLPSGTLAGFFRIKMFDEVLRGKLPMSVFVDDVITTVRGDFGINVDRTALYEAMRASRVIEPQSATLINELRPNYRLAVLTNNTTDLVDPSDGVEVPWWTDDGGHDIVPGDFDLVMSSSELGLTKPDPRIYAELLQRLDVAPSDVVYVDDTAANLPPAQTLGMATIEYRDAEQCRSALRALGIRVAAVVAHDRQSDADLDHPVVPAATSAEGSMTRAAREGSDRRPPAETGLPRIVLLDGTAELPREVLGNKGFGINAMRRDGLPVPPAFVITTEVCRRYFTDPERTMDSIWGEVLDRMAWLEQRTERTFGRGPRPLLVSVRSGAAQSMPGMLDTVLDLGMDDAVEEALGLGSTPSFARDTRDRFRHMYGRIVLGNQGDSDDAVPDDPHTQLRGAIEAVFASWNSPRAIAYRKHRGLNDLSGTAVVVQAMVFGNLGEHSGTGVLFSRNPMTGAKEPFGEWLPGGQGEDVVSGAFDCEPLSTLRDGQPKVYRALMAAARKLEERAADVQDIEYTVEDGRLWLLQTRDAKRSAQAAVRLALQLHQEGLIDDAEALRRVTPAHVETLLLPSLQPETRLAAPLLATGLPACPGVVSGRAYSDVDEAIAAADEDEDVILVRTSTSPDDVQGMLAARGIVTEIGGVTSHAAVVSRELGRPSVVGCGAGTAEAVNGKLITVDGSEGEVREGILVLTAWSEDDTPDLRSLADIARRISPLRAHSVGSYPTLENYSETAVHDAVAAGVTDVVCKAPLLTMLTALQLDHLSAPRSL